MTEPLIYNKLTHKTVGMDLDSIDLNDHPLLQIILECLDIGFMNDPDDEASALRTACNALEDTVNVIRKGIQFLEHEVDHIEST